MNLRAILLKKFCFCQEKCFIAKELQTGVFAQKLKSGISKRIDKIIIQELFYLSKSFYKIYKLHLLITQQYATQYTCLEYTPLSHHHHHCHHNYHHHDHCLLHQLMNVLPLDFECSVIFYSVNMDKSDFFVFHYFDKYSENLQYIFDVHILDGLVNTSFNHSLEFHSH